MRFFVDCSEECFTKSTLILFPLTCCTKHKTHDKQEPVFIKTFRCTEKNSVCSRTYCCYDTQSNEFEVSSEDSKTRKLEDCGDGPMSKYSKVLHEIDFVTSTKRGSRTVQRAVATSEQTKIRLSYFVPNEIFNKMEYTLALSLYNYNQFSITSKYLWITNIEHLCVFWFSSSLF